MDWTNTAHVMQAIFWCIPLVAFSLGFNAGNRM